MTGSTRCDPHKTLVLCLAGLGKRLPVTAVYVLDQALKGHVVNAGSALSCIVDLYFLSAGSVDQDIMDFLRIIFKRSIKIKVILCRQGIQNRPRKASRLRAGLPAKDDDRSLVNTQGLIRDHQILIKFHLISQTETVRAGAERVIEGEASRLHLLDADPAVRAGKALAEVDRLAASYIHDHQTVGQLHHRLDGVRQTFLDPRLHNETVHNDLDIVLDILLQRDLLRQLVEISIDHHADIAAALCLFQNLLMTSFSSTDHWR